MKLIFAYLWWCLLTAGNVYWALVGYEEGCKFGTAFNVAALVVCVLKLKQVMDAMNYEVSE